MQEATNFLETHTSAEESKIVLMTANSGNYIIELHGKIHERTQEKNERFS